MRWKEEGGGGRGGNSLSADAALEREYLSTMIFRRLSFALFVFY